MGTHIIARTFLRTRSTIRRQ